MLFCVLHVLIFFCFISDLFLFCEAALFVMTSVIYSVAGFSWAQHYCFTSISAAIVLAARQKSDVHKGDFVDVSSSEYFVHYCLISHPSVLWHCWLRGRKSIWHDASSVEVLASYMEWDANDLDDGWAYGQANATATHHPVWLSFWYQLIPGVPVVLKFLKFQSCPDIVLKSEIVLKF